MMKRYHIFTLGICLLTTSIAFSQPAQEKVDTAAVSAIKNEAMEHSQVMEILSYLSDVYGPRLTWSPEYKQAAEWASSKLREWGLQDIHYEGWTPMGKGWTLKGFSAEVIEPRAFPLIAYPKAWSPGVKGTVRGEAVYLKAKTEEDLQKYKGKLKNAFVLVDDPRPLQPHFKPDATRLTDSALVKLADAGPQRGPMFRADSAMIQRFIKQMQFSAQKLEFCQKEGAAVLFSNSPGDDGTIYVSAASVPAAPKSLADLFSDRTSPYSAEAPKILPQVVISAEQYNRMVRMIEKGEKPKIAMHLEVAFTKPDSGFNIIAEIPGTDLKDEVVMIGGHFDSWHSGTGATDNGSGSAVSMEAVRILQKLGLKPRRTIRIGLWGGEEEGLDGSRAYVERHFAERSGNFITQMMGGGGAVKTKPGYEKFSVYFNNDNGTGKARGVYLQGNEAARPIFREWLSAYNDPTAQTLTLSNTGGTDHLSFDGVGLPGFQFIQDPIDYGTRTHHSNMDVWDRAQENDLKQAAAIMAVFAYNAAMRPELFPRKPMPTPRSMSGTN
jgi:carboxypeptidase Q